MNDREEKLYEILDRDFGSSWAKHSALSDFPNPVELFSRFKSHWQGRIESLGIIFAPSDFDDRTAELNARKIGDFCVPDPASHRSMGKNEVWLVVPNELAAKILVLGGLP